jgi:dihydropteroate synthase
MIPDTTLGETRIGARTFRWGERTFVMGILNVTPDSFSGDGLLGNGDASPNPVDAAVTQARLMIEAGAELLDVGGASTRPGHDEVDEAEELRRVVPIVRAVRGVLRETPITIDTTKPAVAAAALDAGADAINDIWGVSDDDALVRLAAARGVPVILMHNRAEPVYADLLPEVIADLRRAVAKAERAGVPRGQTIIDPGIGFGKTAEQNLEVLRNLGRLRELGRPILLGTSRKSTLGKVLDLPADQRVEATLTTTALGIARGADIVRVHDVRENVRAARMADAIVRGWAP